MALAMEKQMIVGEVPVSPFSRLFSMPGLDCFNIVTIGFKNEASPSAFTEGLKNTLLNHPRFSCILETGPGEHKPRWIPTQVNIKDHVVVPNIDPTIDNPDQFLEDYTSNMVFSPIDKCKPLWEIHILNIKTSDAESLVVARFHHSLGDGMSLMSLLLACSRKTSDPEALPTLVAPKLSKVTNVWSSLAARLWLIIRLMFNTIVEVFKFLLIVCSFCDNRTPLMEKPSATRIPNKFIHRVISLDDVKVVKNAMNMTVNDVILGMVQAGLSRYLSQKYDTETNPKLKKSLEKICLRGVVFFNLRSNKKIEDLAKMMEKRSTSRWGNSIGYAMIPLWMRSENDIFEYIRRAKTTMDRKKLSLEPLFSYVLLKLTVEVFGSKALRALAMRIFGRSTIILSNVAGPTEEISLFDHQISYVSASISGFPQALIVHITSYVSKAIINLGVDLDVIPDPHNLCDHIVEALQMMKSAVEDKISADLIV
ncbi:O-acyltransferase (WSD1-like) family protein [Raphanus sativus]|uniref:Wax ester synthase/diacylglycerol acyltransferase 2-like isoform X2 n=1 Tax=Raphanus sativus TaxID=3726 RepID=A0A6J0LLF1_RAPSA|nr:wax ester synthase/diacylglycerol acyltransferase 2-like isoform X2 [Raphanus sativus]KAJ4909468.1 O-acyltransferase (WSD1-like) family protein [Raphanus sativus]